MSSKNINNYKFKCFLPKKLYYLSQVKTINYKGEVLKTAYIAHFLNELISKHFLTGEYVFTIWSMILQKLYGKKYARYTDFLVDNGIIHMTSNKQVGVTSRKYKLNLRYIDGEKVIRIYFYDRFIKKKMDARKLDVSFTSLKGSPISKPVREKLVNDLSYVSLDCAKSIEYLNSVKDTLTSESYIKNIVSVNQIETDDIYYKFDSYGRFHTNFTTIKKHLRNNFVRIDGCEVGEVDIKNSQPFFLGMLMKEEYKGKVMPDGIKNYIDLSSNHLFYEDFQSKAPALKDRVETKNATYKVLFGDNKNNSLNRAFKSSYPEVYDFIIKYKAANGGYQSLSHTLQRMESNFIFNGVVNELMIFYPDIKIFTVHDSIVFPVKYKKQVEDVFNKHLADIKGR